MTANYTSNAQSESHYAPIAMRIYQMLLDTLKSARWADLGRYILTFGLPFTVYALTAAPTVYRMDSAELTTAAATGGFVHPTGYPLYLILGWLWTRIPVGDMGFRMNLFSALNGALTITLIAHILRRLRVRTWATWGVLGLLATGYYFWALSLIAEVYTLHTTMMTVMILLALNWFDSPTPRNLAWLCLTTGLSFGNHAATILLVPGLAFLVLASRGRQITPKEVLIAAGAFALGLSVYLYLPIRYAARPEFNYLQHYDVHGNPHPIDLQTLSGLWSVVSGKAFRTLMLSDPNLWGSVRELAIQLTRDFWFIGIGPGILGLIVLWKKHRRIGGMFILMFVSHALFYIRYQVPDKATMFLPNYVIMGIWAGVGVEHIFSAIEDSEQTGASLRLTWLLRAVLSATVLLALAWNWPLVDLSRTYDARREAEETLERLEPNALILGQWDTIPTIEYLQLLEGKRPDVQAINRFLISTDDMYGLISKEIRQRPIYLDSIDFEILRSFDFTYADGLYQLSDKEGGISTTKH